MMLDTLRVVLVALAMVLVPLIGGCGKLATEIVVDLRLDPTGVWPLYKQYDVLVNGQSRYSWKTADFSAAQEGWKQRVVFGQKDSASPSSFTMTIQADGSTIAMRNLVFVADRALLVPITVGPQCTPLAPCGIAASTAAAPDYSESCPFGQGVCGMTTQCIDVQADAANCGECGKACSFGQSCNAGVCM